MATSQTAWQCSTFRPSPANQPPESLSRGGEVLSGSTLVGAAFDLIASFSHSRKHLCWDRSPRRGRTGQQVADGASGRSLCNRLSGAHDFHRRRCLARQRRSNSRPGGARRRDALSVDPRRSCGDHPAFPHGKIRNPSEGRRGPGSAGACANGDPGQDGYAHTRATEQSPRSEQENGSPTKRCSA